jgi:nitrogen fixation NifU-like protein
MELSDLYRQVILDHNKSPRNFGRLVPADAEADGYNPLCGDRLHVSLRLAEDRVPELRFDGSGCAISVASASLMSEAVAGHTRAEIESLSQQVIQMLTQTSFTPKRDLGKLMALAGVHEFPARVKCASLCWHTLNAALESGTAMITTE